MLAGLFGAVPAVAGGWVGWWLAGHARIVLATLSACGGIAVTLLAVYAIGDRIGLRGYGYLRQALADRLGQQGIDVSQALFVGYSPGAETASFDNDTNLDVGFLILGGDELRYHGDGLAFALPKAHITSVRRAQPLQGIRRTVISWQDPSTGPGAMTVEPLDVRNMQELRRACRPFFERILAWWGGPPDAPPAFDSVGSAAYVRAYGGQPVPAFARPAGAAYLMAGGPSLALAVLAAWAIEATLRPERAFGWLLCLIVGFIALEQVLAAQIQRRLDQHG